MTDAPKTSGPAPQDGEASLTDPQARTSTVWHTLLDKPRLHHRARRKRRRHIRWFVLGMIVVALVGLYSYMTSDAQVERLVEQYLRGLFGTEVNLREAHFSVFGGLDLEGISVETEDDAESLFRVDRLKLVHDPLLLLVGQLRVREIIALGPEINLVHRGQQWNFQKLMADGAGPAGAAGPEQRPVIYVERGQVHVKQFDADGNAVYAHSLNLSGVVQPDAARTGVFTFFTSELTTTGFRGNISSGVIDTNRGVVSFEGRAASVELSAELAETLPPTARRVWETFQPQGTVGLRVTFKEVGGELGFNVEVTLGGVALTYHHRGRAFRLSDLTGQCVIKPTRLELLNVHGVLTATLPGPEPDDAGAAPDAADNAEPPAPEEVSVAVGLSGALTGLDSDSFGQELKVEVEDLDMARLRPVVAGMWPEADDFYREFRPQGRMDVAVSFHREPTPGAELEVSGKVKVKGGRTVYHLFPLPVENTWGEITLSSRRVRIEKMVGHHGASSVSTSGWIDDPGNPEGALELRIVGRHVELNDEIEAALQRLNPASYEVYKSLRPEGEVDVSVLVTYTPGNRGIMDTEVEITLLGNTVSYDGFPYRITGGRGTIAIGKTGTRIDVAGRHGPADVTVRGTITGEGEQTAVDLVIDARDVPMDEELAAALPEQQRETYRQYHLQGQADVRVHVTQSAETAWQPEHRATIDLQDVAMVFEAFPYPVEGIQGQMEIGPGGFVIRDLRGTNADAALACDGRVEHVGDSYTADLTVRGQNVLLDRDLRGALALVAPGLWDNISPEGRVDVVCRLVKDADPDAELRAEVDLVARDVSIVYRHFPYPLRHCRGRLRYDGRRVIIDGLENVEGATTIAVAGTIDLPPEGGVDSRLAVEASGLEVDPALIGALPSPVARGLEALAVRARMNINLPELTYAADADGGNLRIGWQGSAVVDNASMDLGVPVDRVVAYVKLAGQYAADHLTLDGTVDMPQGRVAGKEFRNLRAELHQAPQSDRIAITRLEADCYGGRLELESEGSLALGDPGGYGLSVLVRDVDFARFARESLGIDLGGGSGGRLSGEFALWGQEADPDSLQARARFHITDATLYELPLVVRLLNVLRLDPGAQSFSEGEVRLFIRNRTYVFDRIMLRGGGLAVHGAGQMLQDGRVHLVFATGSGDDPGVVSALDELARGVMGELILVEVTGTVRDPVIRQHTLHGLTAPLRELAQIVREGNQQARESALP